MKNLAFLMLLIGSASFASAPTIDKIIMANIGYREGNLWDYSYKCSVQVCEPGKCNYDAEMNYRLYVSLPGGGWPITFDTNHYWELDSNRGSLRLYLYRRGSSDVEEYPFFGEFYFDRSNLKFMYFRVVWRGEYFTPCGLH